MTKERKSPEEIAALKAKYGNNSAKKEAKKAEKKAKFGDVNADQNLPVCEIKVPYMWADEPSNGKVANREIDLDIPVWQHYLDRCEWNWRCNFGFTQAGYDTSKVYRGPCKRRILRT